MDQKPGKRHLKWLPKPRLDALARFKPRPGAVNRFRRRMPQGGQGFRNWLIGKLPASKGAAPPTLGSSGWDPVPPSLPAHPGRSPRALLGRLRPASRRQRVGVAAGAGGLVLLSLIGITVLCSHMLVLGNNTPTAGGASSHAKVSAASATNTASASMTATAAPPLTVDFTCASGSIRRTGTVCVHTQANASLSLTVRYCGGGHGGARSYHGSGSANDSGDYTWRFSVRTKCAGAATATVTATLAGQTVTQSTIFNITR